MNIRAFIAAVLPPEAERIALKCRNNIINEGIPGIRQVKNFHVTTQFLGDIPESTAQNIVHSCLKRLPENFMFSLGKITAFPREDRARIIVIDMVSEDIKKIKKTVDEILLKDYNIEPEEREFRPHITLARLKVPATGISDILKKVQPENTEFTCDTLCLFKSVLTPKGPLYSVIGKLN